MKYQITETQKMLQENLREKAPQLRDTFAKSYREQEIVLDYFLKSIEHCDFNGFDKDKVILNAAAFVNVVSLDLKHHIADMLFSEDEWSKRLHARSISMLLFETQLSIPNLLGRDFFEAVAGLSIVDTVKTNLKSINMRLRSFKDQHVQGLKATRNTATAHRDLNVVSQVQEIMKLDWMAVFTQAKELDDILNDLGPILQKTVNVSIDEIPKK